MSAPKPFIVFLRLQEINEHLKSKTPLKYYGKRQVDSNDVGACDALAREKLEHERDAIIDGAVKNHPDLKVAASEGGKKAAKCVDKVYVPQKEYPQINFIGQLIGPRGSTLKEMENETGAKISIRGKGSHKDGKARMDQESEDEELHAYISADTEDKVAAAIRMINKIIEAVSRFLSVYSILTFLGRIQWRR